MVTGIDIAAEDSSFPPGCLEGWTLEEAQAKDKGASAAAAVAIAVETMAVIAATGDNPNLLLNSKEVLDFPTPLFY